MPVYFLGMLIGKGYHKIQLGKITSIISSLFFSISIVVWHLFMFKDQFALDRKIKYFGGTNPPGISEFVFAILILGLGISIDAFIRIYKIKFLIYLEEKISILGKFSYYIFLFHLLIISMLRVSSVETLISNNIWLKRFTYLFVTFGVSILLGFFIEKLMMYLMKAKKGKIREELL